jgi:hypothetical protein
MARYVLLTGDETRTDLAEAIANLRERRRMCGIASTRAEIDDEIDELVALWVASR